MMLRPEEARVESVTLPTLSADRLTAGDSNVADVAASLSLSSLAAIPPTTLFSLLLLDCLALRLFL
jgi:hypothetical protein